MLSCVFFQVYCGNVDDEDDEEDEGDDTRNIVARWLASKSNSKSKTKH